MGSEQGNFQWLVFPAVRGWSWLRQEFDRGELRNHQEWGKEGDAVKGRVLMDNVEGMIGVDRVREGVRGMRGLG